MVEIYQNEELNDVCFDGDSLEQWRILNEELGLYNQLDFIKSSESPVPYPYINASMDIIFSTLCPRKVDFKKFDKSPIPLEVLKQLSYSVKENHFTKIEIWYDDKSPDPFAIGLIEQYYVYDNHYFRLKDSAGNEMNFKSEVEAKDYAEIVGFEMKGVSYHAPKKYLIARWADAIRPLAELKELAKGRLIEKYGASIKNDIEAKTRALNKLTNNVTLYLGGEMSESELNGCS